MLKTWIPLFAIFLTAPFVLLQGCSKSEPSFRIYFVGDLLLDRGVRDQINKHGADALFTDVKPIFKEADAVVANLECPVTVLRAPVNKRYIFRAEPEYLRAVRNAGITHLILANNHTYDQGRDGLKDTYHNILINDLCPVGYGLNQENACKPVIIEKNGIKVALFSSVLLTLEGWAYLPDSAGICQATVSELAVRIRNYKAANANSKVIVILHWGAEFQTTPQPEQRLQAQQLVDAGADAIIGHHPHVIQTEMTYKGKPIFFSIGNFVFDQHYAEANKGEIVELTFSESGQKYRVQTTRIENCVPGL